MKVTHVIRGAEYVASTPKYLSLYEALNIAPTILAHVPHILAPSGNKKLGKRDGAKSVSEYRDDGILPKAMLNFLAQLGWNDGTEKELYSLDELIKTFSLERVQKSGARFDEQRLLWLNGQWIRKIPLDDLLERCSNFWGESAKNATPLLRRQVLELVFDRLKTLSDLPLLTSYFFEEPVVDETLISGNKQLKKLTDETRRDLLQQSHDRLAALTDWSPDYEIGRASCRERV